MEEHTPRIALRNAALNLDDTNYRWIEVSITSSSDRPRTTDELEMVANTDSGIEIDVGSGDKSDPRYDFTEQLPIGKKIPPRAMWEFQYVLNG